VHAEEQRDAGGGRVVAEEEDGDEGGRRRGRGRRPKPCTHDPNLGKRVQVQNTEGGY